MNKKKSIDEYIKKFNEENKKLTNQERRIKLIKENVHKINTHIIKLYDEEDVRLFELEIKPNMDKPGFIEEIKKYPNIYDYRYRNKYFSQMSEHVSAEPDVDHILERIKKERELEKNKKIKKIHWTSEPEKLEKLLKILHEENLLKTEKINTVSGFTSKYNFYFQENNSEVKEIEYYLYWQSKACELIYLIDLLVKEDFIKSKYPNKIIYDHFRQKDGTIYNTDSLTSQRNKIKKTGRRYPKIDEVIKKLKFVFFE